LASRLGAAVTAGVLAVPVSPVLGVAVGGLVWARPAWSARSRRRAAERDLVEAVPDLVELFRLAIASGLSVHQAVRALAPRLHGPGADALVDVVASEDRGERLADGLERLGRRGEPLQPLAAALTAAERYGAPLGPALDRAGSEAREVRRRQAEEAARRLPVLLLFPLVLCILPAAALLTVVPLLAASWPHLRG
jgi:tight adherence protein C